MAKSKSEKLKRLVAVQRHLEHMAENDLAMVSRQRAEVLDNLEAAVDAVGSLEPVHQLFSSLYASQITRLTVTDHHLEAMQQVHEQKILRERAKADRLEDNMRDARTDEERVAADDQIYDLVDQKILVDQSQASSKLGRP